MKPLFPVVSMSIRGAVAYHNDVLMCNDSKLIIGEINDVNKDFLGGTAVHNCGQFTAY